MSIALNKFVLKGNTGKMEKIQKIFKPKYIHIAVIILGIIFMSLSIFHTNMWFDESYTIGIVRHSFSEIWKACFSIFFSSFDGVRFCSLKQYACSMRCTTKSE